MTKPETTPSPTTGHTLTELFELGWLKVIPTGIPFQGDVKPHSFEAFGWLLKGIRCTRCGLRDMPNGPYMVRKGLRDGCHLFRKSSTHWVVNGDNINVRHTVGVWTEKAIAFPYTGEESWAVIYPKTGKAWQEDKFINEIVSKELRK